MAQSLNDSIFSMVAEVLIRAEGLSKRYGEGEHAIRVLEDLDLEIRRTERVAIIGESGVGKSTLLHILGTLDRPSGGAGVLGEQGLFALPEAGFAALRTPQNRFVFQIHHPPPAFTALGNLMMPGLIAGLSWADARARAGEMLHKVGLGERLVHRPGELSGGEQQRVAVARALVLGPRVVLADEPTGNLDPVTGEGVLRLLLALNRELGVTMAIVTHSEKVAAAMDRTLRLSGGRLTAVAV